MSQPQPVPPPLEATPWGSVIITPREIYDGLVRVSSQLATIQLQLAQHTTEHQERDERIDARFQDQETRLRKVEFRLWSIPSIATLTSIAAVVVAVIYR